MTGEGLLAGDVADRVEAEPEAQAAAVPENDDGEFQITIRKLELPVRPRGVLAE